MKLKHLFYSVMVVHLFYLVSCTYTTSYEKKPLFSSDLNVVSDQITRIAPVKNITLHGLENKRNGKIETSVLSINVLIDEHNNGTEIMGKQIASIIKNALKDKEEYTSYKVIFNSPDQENIKSTVYFVYPKGEL